MKVVGIIPARLAATRLANKPLLDICGKPMIQRVWEQAKAAGVLSEVIVATPDVEIFEAVQKFGGIAAMTSDKHRSGTDRLAELASTSDADIFVNIQGDEPLIEPGTIALAVQPLLNDAALPMSSLMCACPEDEWNNPSTVKVVCALNGDALYFSRYGLPFLRNPDSPTRPMQHIGLYAYRREFLLTFSSLPPGRLETTESLEQLRVLENGFRINMVEVNKAPLSVDTYEDLLRVISILEGKAIS